MTVQNQYDAIIIGSGPGGGMVAKDLTQYGKKVLILERGDYKPTKGTFSQMLSRGWLPGTQMPVTKSLKPIVRGITTGGTSNLYTATAYPPDYEMLERYGVDIAKEIEELKEELPIAPLSDHLMSPAANLFMKTASEMGYDAFKYDKYIYQDNCRQNCDACMLGCPNDAKWNSRYLIDEAVKNGAEIINGAMVKQVLSEGDIATGVSYSKGGRSHHVYAPRIVMSAGGIGSPLILRKSGFDHVGEDVCGDPLLVVCGKIPGLEGTGKAVPMQTGFHLKDEGIMFSDLHMPKVLKSLFDAHAFNFGEMSDFADVLPIMVKIRDDLSGKIVNNGFVDKPISAADKAKLDLGKNIATDILKQAGATKVYSSRILVAHPGAGIKLGEHLDENLKTKKFNNLYVCDASVFPEPLGRPPSLSILGMGKRLAKHLAAQNDWESIHHNTAALEPAE